MPLLIREIVGPDGTVQGRDGQGAYGYSTAFWLDGREGNGERFWRAVGDWSRGEGLVSLVARLPLSGNWMRWPGNRFVVSANVVRTLQAPNALWRDFEHKVRKNVKKAKRSGVSVRIGPPPELADQFINIYLETMTRRRASSSFHLDAGDLDRLYHELSSRAMIAVASLEGRPVSAELVLLEGDSMLSFLGGTLEDAFPFRPNDLLKYELMLWGQQTGLDAYVLGGGPEGEDGILRYKRSFAPGGVVDFEIGEWRVLPDRYEELERLFGLALNETSGPTRFPHYRI
jgi:hypothetical protein